MPVFISPTTGETKEEFIKRTGVEVSYLDAMLWEEFDCDSELVVVALLYYITHTALGVMHNDYSKECIMHVADRTAPRFFLCEKKDILPYVDRDFDNDRRMRVFG